MAIRSALAALAASLAFLAPSMAADFNDPDWPCMQRKVSELTVGQMWPGPPPQGQWREDPEIRALAQAIAPRRTPMPEIEAMVADYAGDLPEAERGPKLALVFAGVLSLIDAERAQLIQGIGRYAGNQTILSTKVEEMQGELAELAAAEVKDFDRIEEIEDTLDWETRIFRDRAQALTYVCETPVLMEQRAFAIARAMATQI